MPTYAQLDGTGQVVFVVTTTADPTPGMVDISDANPQPGPGWTTSDGGQTWAEPAPDSLLAAGAQGQTIVHQLAATIAAQLTQAEADAAIFNSWMETQTIFPPDIAPIVQRCGPSAWITLLEGLMGLVNAQWGPLGLSMPVIPPPPTVAGVANIETEVDVQAEGVDG